jgi:cytochrome P450
MAAATEEIYWDPFDTDIDANPYGIWKQMRDEAPVYRNERHDFYALSRFADVEAASKDPLTFSSSHGTVLEIMGDAPMDTGMMLFMDPPEHTKLRALVSRAFTPRRIAAQTEAIRAICDGLLDRVGSEFDFVQDFAARVPSMVISKLFGVPPDEQEACREMIDQTFHLEPGVGMINETSFHGQIKLHGYVTAQLTDRRNGQRNDMFTDLVQAEIKDDDGTTRRLSIAEAADFALLIIAAGTETVARLLGWAAILLDQHPDQRAALAADPGLMANAVEELLRYEAPSPVQGRWLTSDVELHGTTIPASSRVLLLTGSAGRDERQYPGAEAFDIRRSFDAHLSFGYGIHFCIGAALARMEGRIALEAILDRFPEWKVDHERAVRLHTSTVRGWTNVPVSVRPDRSS